MLSGIFGQIADFARMLPQWIQSFDVPLVFLVHDEYEIELLQVGGCDFTRGPEHFITTLDQMMAHAMVGRIALMQTDGAGGINEKLRATPCLLHIMMENDLSGRRSADVAHADKENGFRWGLHDRILEVFIEFTSNFCLLRCYCP